MRRDMDLVRKLLLAIEEREDLPEIAAYISVEGYEPKAISYHAKMLIDKGLVEGTVDSGPLDNSGPMVVVNDLSSAGHDFVEAIRNESRWKEAIDYMKGASDKVSVGVAVKAITDLLQAIF